MKYQTVYTAGVFDLFHIGHLNILKKAAELGSTVVVGVSSDELVLAYKGRPPVVPFEERSEIIAALKYVSEVVPQKSLNKVDVWHSIKFDCWVVGNDHEADPQYRAYASELAELGVESVFANYTQGVSSSGRRARILNDP